MLRQKIILTRHGGTLESVGGSYIPTAITFSIRDSGEYTLEEYWKPRNGSYCAEDIRDKFPGAATDGVLNNQTYIKKMQTQNYKLLDAILASPAAALNPSDYMQTHEPECQELDSYGEYTLRYCFFAERMPYLCCLRRCTDA